jgi:type IV fimbrial biogenesis protein FimT
MIREKGFTLIELLIALFVSSILGMAAFPFAKSFLEHKRQKAEVYQLINTIQYTRMAAIRLEENTTFCGSSDGVNCNGKWNKGQLIKTNKQVLRVFSDLSKNANLTWKSNFNQNQALIFSPTGFTNGQQGSFYYQLKGRTYRIVISYAGTIRLETS